MEKEVENTWGEVLVAYWALLAPTLLELRARRDSGARGQQGFHYGTRR